VSEESGAGTGPAREPAAAAIDRLARDLDGIEVRKVGSGREFLRDGTRFAAEEGTNMVFRLSPEIVSAALHTEGTSRSSRGPEWVTLDTAATDEFTLDRATAWFEAAWRLAPEPGPQRPH